MAGGDGGRTCAGKGRKEDLGREQKLCGQALRPDYYPQGWTSSFVPPACSVPKGPRTARRDK